MWLLFVFRMCQIVTAPYIVLYFPVVFIKRENLKEPYRPLWSSWWPIWLAIHVYLMSWCEWETCKSLEWLPGVNADQCFSLLMWSEMSPMSSRIQYLPCMADERAKEPKTLGLFGNNSGLWGNDYFWLLGVVYFQNPNYILYNSA